MLQLLFTVSIALAQSQILGKVGAEVPQSAPSCRILRHRLMQDKKSIDEWTELHNQLAKEKPFSKNLPKLLREISILTGRINSVIGVLDSQTVGVSVEWVLPSGFDIKNKVLGITSAIHEWLGPWEQLPENFGVRWENSTLKIQYRLTPVEFCLGTSEVQIQIGDGWESPYQNLMQVDYHLSANFKQLRESAFNFFREVL